MNLKLYIADLRSNNNNGICTGHFFAVAENYEQMFKDVCSVKIAGGPIYEKHFSKEKLFLLPCDSICNESKIKNVFRTVRNAWHLFRHVKSNDVVVIQQSVPAMLLFSVLLTYFGSSNVFMIQYNKEPMNRLYFRVMMMLARNRIKGVICPNDSVGIAYKRPFLTVPDYVYSSKVERFKVPCSLKKYDFCIVGRLNKDKGIIEVINHFKGKKYSVIIAGSPNNDSFKRDIVKAKENYDNIELQLRYISDDEYKSFLLSSRYCILNYQGDYANRSSGVVFDTIFSGVPVIGRKCEALQFVQQEQVGFLYTDINDLDPEKIMNSAVYDDFLKKIDSYRQSHAQHKERLQNFLHLK